ncbi:hypothetical protein RHS01_04597 [Rhizoctonia solani]|uniref:Hemopexin n=1 Tax=Rhizoctonia solani TaxID=456999 RepID=A0A8H7IH53_9AGAM|nr:hypothetical protein RHS01_04597 [Rhizoctonia solani]
MPGRGVVNIAGTNKTYFFHGDKYAQVEWSAGFKRVDAVLPIRPHPHRAYFFCGDKYQRIDYVPDPAQEEALDPLRTIDDSWQALSLAGLKHVDAVPNVPGTTNETYLFCDNKYIRTSWYEGKKDEDILEGPKYISQGWGITGFARFDMVLPHLTKPDHVYIFSEQKYVQVKVCPGGEHQLISDQRPIGKDWWP